ncbi:putative protein JASON [Helianthus annuus]|nr:putative protein JASON [Helianthus annuus]
MKSLLLSSGLSTGPNMKLRLQEEFCDYISNLIAVDNHISDELKQFSGLSCTPPRKSPGKSPDDMPIIGSVGSYWSHMSSAQSSSSCSSYKGISNATSKYREVYLYIFKFFVIKRSHV